MALEKLSPEQLAGGQAIVANPQYLDFLKSCRVGEGGRAIVADEGVGRPTLKRRISQAAAAANISIKFHRSSPEELVFEVTGKH